MKCIVFVLWPIWRGGVACDVKECCHLVRSSTIPVEVDDRKEWNRVTVWISEGVNAFGELSESRSIGI